MFTVKTKRDWYSINDLFNGPISWPLDVFLQIVDDDTIYTTQNRQRTGAPFFKEPGSKMRQLIEGGELDSGYQILECVPPPGVRSIVQGEFDGVNGRVSYVNEPMRMALEIAQIHFTRKELLRHVGFKYYQQLMDITEMFPDHIIEFSIYDTPIGRLHQHMIIWEVRSY